jgi:phage RecT family recombinase
MSARAAPQARRDPPPAADPREAGNRMVRLVEERGYLASILGSDPATVERFKTVLLSALTSSPKLLQADPATLVQAMREAAMWDLEPDGIDAVIVAYWSSKRSVYVADFQPTARGYVRVLYRSPRVRFVDADVVYENDHFEYEKGAVPKLVHRPLVFGDRGTRIGAYALVQLDSGFVRPIVLNEEQIAARRRVARDAEAGPWAEWPDEMARKTALRALMSLVPIARGVKAALAAEDAKYAALPAPAPVAALPAAASAPMPALLAARAAFVGPDEPTAAEPAPGPEPEPEDGSWVDAAVAEYDQAHEGGAA